MTATGACASPEAEPDDLEFRATELHVNTLLDLPRIAAASPCTCATLTPGVCSLRAAVQTANVCTMDTKIVLTVSGTYLLGPGPAVDDDDEFGDLDIFQSTTIMAGAAPDWPPVSATVNAGNQYRVFDIHPESGPVTLAGFKVVRGKIDPSPFPVGDANGGCIRARSSEVIMHNMIVGGEPGEGCSGHYGGGVYAEESSVTMESTILADNAALAWANGLSTIDGLGGGLFTIDTELNMTDSQALENSATGGGGGVAIFSAATAASFSDIVLDGNETFKAGGGGFMAAPFTIVDSLITNNSVIDGPGQGGGGLYVSSSDSGTTSTVHGSSISGNLAQHGGGISVAGSLEVFGSNINSNVAAGGQLAPRGGGIFGGAEGSIALERSTVVGNKAEQGGGVYVSHQLEATNSTLSRNEATTDGGGLYAGEGSAFNLLHCTLRDNSAANAGGGAWVDAGSLAQLDRSAMYGNSQSAGPPECTGPLTTPTVAVSDLASCVTPVASVISGAFGGWGPLTNNGNFTSTYTIGPPNSALSTAIPCGVAEDQWGQPRDSPCDIGAYENQTN